MTSLEGEMLFLYRCLCGLVALLVVVTALRGRRLGDQLCCGVVLVVLLLRVMGAK